VGSSVFERQSVKISTARIPDCASPAIKAAVLQPGRSVSWYRWQLDTRRSGDRIGRGHQPQNAYRNSEGRYGDTMGKRLCVLSKLPDADRSFI
jgi:hypothetical protein